MSAMSDPEITVQPMDADMPDFSSPMGDDFQALSRDRIPIRSLSEDDLTAIVRIDRKLTGRDRHDYFQAKLREVMSETGVRVSLVAEIDGQPVGFIMARADYGEFGRAESAAVIDTLGVLPDFARSGVGSALLSQLLVNLHALQVERVRTSVVWNDFSLLEFLSRSGFAPGQQIALTKTLEVA